MRLSHLAQLVVGYSLKINHRAVEGVGAESFVSRLPQVLGCLFTEEGLVVGKCFVIDSLEFCALRLATH